MRRPLQPLQPLQKVQLQPPFGPSVDSLCHPCITTTNLSYRFPIFETSATALCGTTGYIYILSKEVLNSNFRQYGQMKSRGGKSQRREEEKKEDQEEKKVIRKKMKGREKVGKSRNAVFVQCFVAPEGRKVRVGSLKRRVRSHLGR